jgi:hypothetical protein
MAPMRSSNNSNFYLNQKLNQKLNPRLVIQRRELPVSTSSKNPNSKSSMVPGVFLSCPKGDNPSPAQSLAAALGKAPQPYHTFFTLVLPVMTSGGTEGETQLLESFHLAMEILLDADKPLVIYVWPKKLAQQISVQPYGKKHLDKSYNKAKKIASKVELLCYVSSVYISEGTKCYMKIYCGHNDPQVILVLDLVRQNLHNNQMNLWLETLQAASSMVCRWLLGADTKTFDCDHLTELLRTLPKFANLPVACRKRIVKLNITEKFANPKTAPQGIVILCDGEFLTETNIAIKATFNRSSTKAIAEQLDGLNFKYIEYYAELKSKIPTHKQAAQTIKARV